jgi:pimeloyl-ACP methyl ester carboxylesterase
VLEDAGQLTALKVEGFGDAVVAVPAAPAPRPLVLATHGNYDRPSWQCQEWQQLLRDRAFVLCPRGSARPDSPGPDDVRFTYGSNEELEREIDAGMAALKARYGAWLVDGPVVYTGFSLGAILGVKIAARRPASFPRLVLIEGGHDGWTYARVKAFAAGGGKRVLFACGQKGCQLAAASAAQRLRATEVDSRVVLAPGVGHSYGGPVSGLIAEELPWLLAPATPE